MPDGTPVASTVVPAFLCPSDAHPEGNFNAIYTPVSDEPFAKSNYVAVAGAGDGDNNALGEGHMSNLNNSDWQLIWGVFGKNFDTTFANISDGSTNVILLGERSSRNNIDSGDTNAYEAGVGAIWAGVGNRNEDYPKVDTRTGEISSSGDEVSKDWSVFGHMYSESPENWSINGRDTPRGIASSYHNGGANVALGDRSARFVSENLNVGTLADLCRMADGQVVEGF